MGDTSRVKGGQKARRTQTQLSYAHTPHTPRQTPQTSASCPCHFLVVIFLSSTPSIPPPPSLPSMPTYTPALVTSISPSFASNLRKSEMDSISTVRLLTGAEARVTVVGARPTKAAARAGRARQSRARGAIMVD